MAVEDVQADGDQDQAATHLDGGAQPVGALEQTAQVQADTGEQGGDQADEQGRKPDVELEQRET